MSQSVKIQTQAVIDLLHQMPTSPPYSTDARNPTVLYDQNTFCDRISDRDGHRIHICLASVCLLHKVGMPVFQELLSDRMKPGGTDNYTFRALHAGCEMLGISKEMVGVPKDGRYMPYIFCAVSWWPDDLREKYHTLVTDQMFNNFVNNRDYLVANKFDKVAMNQIALKEIAIEALGRIRKHGGFSEYAGMSYIKVGESSILVSAPVHEEEITSELTEFDTEFPKEFPTEFELKAAEAHRELLASLMESEPQEQEQGLTYAYA